MRASVRYRLYAACLRMNRECNRRWPRMGFRCHEKAEAVTRLLASWGYSVERVDGYIGPIEHSWVRTASGYLVDAAAHHVGAFHEDHTLVLKPVFSSRGGLASAYLQHPLPARCRPREENVRRLMVLLEGEDAPN